MTDRQLLELAAKACGLQEAKQRIEFNQWNPLEDDGDALRLSCKLLMQIIQDGVGFVKVGWHVGVEIGTPTADGRGPWYWKEWLHVANGDRGIATRRAITRAAAEIGRAMP